MNNKKTGLSFVAKFAAIVTFGILFYFIGAINAPYEPSPDGAQPWVSITLISGFIAGFAIACRSLFSGSRAGVLVYILIGSALGFVLVGLQTNTALLNATMLGLLTGPIMFARLGHNHESQNKSQRLT